MHAPHPTLTTPTPPRGFSGRRTATIVGISYRQLDYWARTGLLRPSITDATGSGSRRQYSLQDLQNLTLYRALLDAGVQLERVRSMADRLDPHWADHPAAVAVVGHRTVAVIPPDQLPAAVAAEPGPVIVVPVAAICAQVLAAVADVDPSHATLGAHLAHAR